jgi:EAL domain-containing protein (putative c-di-GMP-specific phosphodiesterase class I)
MYRFNHSEYNLEKYREFLIHLTGIQPENLTLQLTEEDLIGRILYFVTYTLFLRYKIK